MEGGRKAELAYKFNRYWHINLIISFRGSKIIDIHMADKTNHFHIQIPEPAYMNTKPHGSRRSKIYTSPFFFPRNISHLPARRHTAMRRSWVQSGRRADGRRGRDASSAKQKPNSGPRCDGRPKPGTTFPGSSTVPMDPPAGEARRKDPAESPGRGRWDGSAGGLLNS